MNGEQLAHRLELDYQLPVDDEIRFVGQVDPNTIVDDGHTRVPLHAESILYELIRKAFVVRGFQESTAEGPVNGDRTPNDTPSKISVEKIVRLRLAGRICHNRKKSPCEHTPLSNPCP